MALITGFRSPAVTLEYFHFWRLEMATFSLAGQGQTELAESHEQCRRLADVSEHRPDELLPGKFASVHRQLV